VKRLTVSLAHQRFANPGYMWDGPQPPWREDGDNAVVAAWQSATWALMAGDAAWLTWTDLSTEEEQFASNMVIFEADHLRS
jgi:hypothetical protein